MDGRHDTPTLFFIFWSSSADQNNMKLPVLQHYNLFLSLLILVVILIIIPSDNGVVTANDDGDDAAAAAAATPDCDAICHDKIQPYITETSTFQQEKDSLLKQLEEATLQRDAIQQELHQIREELAQAHATTNEARTLLESTKEDVKGQYTAEIEALQQSMTLTKEEMAHYQKVAQDNQKYMQEYKNQLHSQRDKANKLNEALKEANLKIEELESTTFLKQLKKEIIMAWEAIQAYWTNLTNKGKTEADAEF